ncbi:hypothetical protein SSCG_04607 [Streptomyces clavuligerus]|nr:hypothetical protein SSCG_04607 [Streptomyces clavuligerus]
MPRPVDRRGTEGHPDAHPGRRPAVPRSPVHGRRTAMAGARSPRPRPPLPVRPPPPRPSIDPSTHPFRSIPFGAPIAGRRGRRAPG